MNYVQQLRNDILKGEWQQQLFSDGAYDVYRSEYVGNDGQVRFYLGVVGPKAAWHLMEVGIDTGEYVAMGISWSNLPKMGARIRGYERFRKGADGILRPLLNGKEMA